MRQAKYIVTLDSPAFGHESTKWDTQVEAVQAVESIRANIPMDGIVRTVRIIHQGKVLAREKMGVKTV